MKKVAILTNYKNEFKFKYKKYKISSFLMKKILLKKNIYI